MKKVRIILLFPLALFRLIMVLMISFVVGITGWFWFKMHGFSRKLQNWSMKTWGRWNMFILGIRVERNEIPQQPNFILMPNHRSYLDIFLIARYTPAAFVGKAELQKWPLLKLGARVTHTIFVSRSEMKSLVNTMKEIKNSVNRNIPVAIFPEGTTTRGPLTKTFKNGSFKIAAESGISIIPMAIHFEDEADSWTDNDTFVGHFFRQMSKPLTKVHIRYGQPVTDNDYKKLQLKTREIIDSMLLELTEGET